MLLPIDKNPPAHGYGYWKFIDARPAKPCSAASSDLACTYTYKTTRRPRVCLYKTRTIPLVFILRSIRRLSNKVRCAHGTEISCGRTHASGSRAKALNQLATTPWSTEKVDKICLAVHMLPCLSKNPRCTLHVNSEFAAFVQKAVLLSAIALFLPHPSALLFMENEVTHVEWVHRRRCAEPYVPEVPEWSDSTLAPLSMPQKPAGDATQHHDPALVSPPYLLNRKSSRALQAAVPPSMLPS
jgi:hypothetical protein